MGVDPLSPKKNYFFSQINFVLECAKIVLKAYLKGLVNVSYYFKIFKIIKYVVFWNHPFQASSGLNFLVDMTVKNEILFLCIFFEAHLQGWSKDGIKYWKYEDKEFRIPFERKKVFFLWNGFSGISVREAAKKKFLH